MAIQSKLTDTQLILLSAASQRDDRLLAQPARLKGGAAQAVTNTLLAAGYVEEVEVRRDDPHWRELEDGKLMGLRITDAGLTAIGVSDEPNAATYASEDARSGPVPGQTTQRQLQSRRNSKRQMVMDLLAREQGATLGDLTSATGWLPHTTRAALTGLRKRGCGLTRHNGPDGQSVYRIIHDPQDSSASNPVAAEG